MQLNNVQLIGNLGNDPTLETVGSDKKKVRLNVAVTRRNQKDGEKPDWFYVIVWGKQAETCAAHLKKGQLVMIDGYLKPFEYEKDGSTRSGFDIVANDVQFGPKAKG